MSVPERDAQSNKLALVVALHYGGQVTPFYGTGLIKGLVGPAFRDLSAIIVAPDSISGNWSTPANEQAIVALTRGTIETYDIDPRRIVLTGFSMGGMGTWFIGSRHPDLFTAAVPVAGSPAIDQTWRLPVFVVHSKDDEVIPIAEARSFVEELKSQGVQVHWKELSGVTHYNVPSFSAATSEAVPWLKELWKSEN